MTSTGAGPPKVGDVPRTEDRAPLPCPVHRPQPNKKGQGGRSHSLPVMLWMELRNALLLGFHRNASVPAHGSWGDGPGTHTCMYVL